jgi:hypothetical protein
MNDGPSDFRLQLVSALPKALPQLGHYALFYEKGCKPPVSNHLNIPDTFRKFCDDFLPQCPIIDPRNRKIKIRKDNFPKFLNLVVREGSFPKKPSSIVESIELGTFVAEEYEWAKDRIEALFWVPDVIRDPDAIFKVKRNGAHLVRAEEIYVKVFDKLGSKVKLVFVDRVGKHKDTIFITSYLTSAHTTIKYCDGKPLYIRKESESTPTSDLGSKLLENGESTPIELATLAAEELK